MPENLVEAAKAIDVELIGWRRHLHANPELSGDEEQTAAFVAQELRKIGLEPHEKIGGVHGVTADLRVDDGPILALRADMDALPITEETGLDFASTRPGVMHACGHDAHTAMLLGAAKLLHERRSELKRSVRLLFQPHEELFPGGAPDMIAGGALRGVDRIFGMHICSDLPSGTFGTRCGGFMAAVNVVRITIEGRGGHAAMPNQCVDPIVTAANIITTLQTVISRNTPVNEPAVVSVTQVHGGTADNVIPNIVELVGTIRTFSDAVRTDACRRVTEIAEGIARTHGAEARVDIDTGYPVLVNDDHEVERALAAARRVGYGESEIISLKPQGGGEDFSYYCREVPGCFVFVGARNEAEDCVYPHHHPRFNIDERMLARGAAMHARVALDAD
jgi:amidohydrolase